MGRELRRRQAKKEGKSLQREVTVEEHQIKKLIIITVVLVVVIGVMYLLSALFITKEFDELASNKDNGDTEILVDNTILASEIFKQAEEEYYVYFYDYDEEDQGISSVVSNILSAATVYKVDTGSALNNNYVSENSNKSAKTLKDLKVKASTVIKVSGEQIVAYYENNEINNLK